MKEKNHSAILCCSLAAKITKRVCILQIQVVGVIGRGKQMKKWLLKYRHIWILSYGLIYLIWFCYLEQNINRFTKYHIMHTELDDKIPFCEFFIVPYLLWFVYVAGAVIFFFFRNRDDYYRLCAFLFTGMTISLIICSFYPNGTNFRPFINPEKNIFSRMVTALYQVDTCTNVFPSIHAFNSIGVHIAVMKSEEIRRMKGAAFIRGGSLLLMLSICMATVFLKQHSILDVAGAIIMAVILYGFIYGYPLFAWLGERNHARRRIKRNSILE